MKTVTPGLVPEIKKWWVGKKAHCLGCGAVVELDENDSPAHYTESVAVFECPTEHCGQHVKIKQPPPPPEPRSLAWVAKCPEDMDEETHINSFNRAVEAASGELRTDYTKEAETIITGAEGRVVILGMDNFFEDCGQEDGKCKAEDGKAYLGKLGRRRVLFDRGMKPDQVRVRNEATGKVCTIHFVDEEDRNSDSPEEAMRSSPLSFLQALSSFPVSRWSRD